MTSIDRFERQLPSALTDLAAPQTPDYLTDILGRTARTRQRPAWASIERWLPMELVTTRVPTTRMPWRQLGVLALIALLLAMLLAAYIGSRTPHLPAPFGPAANGLIAYDAGGDVFLGDPVAGTSTLLSGGPGDVDMAPAFSYDGTQVAFERVATTTTSDLYVIRVDGSGLRKVATEPLEMSWWDWSPDGRTLMVAPINDGQSDLMLLDTKGVDASDRSAPLVLESDRTVDVLEPTYRPDGTEILFRAKTPTGIGLSAVRTDGSGMRVLYPATDPLTYGDDPINNNLRAPRYTHDGSRIYVMKVWDPSIGVRLGVMDPDGGDLHRITNDPAANWEGMAVPSPDGKWVAYRRGTPTSGGLQIAIIATDGSTRTPVLTGIDPTGTGDLEWSPDSTQLLFVPSGGAQEILSVRGGQPKQTVWRSGSWPTWQRLALPS